MAMVTPENADPRRAYLEALERGYETLERALVEAQGRHAATGYRDWGALIDNLRGCMHLLAMERRALLGRDEP